MLALRHALLPMALLPGLLFAAAPASCPDVASQPAVSLAELVDRALCANPGTRAAWQRTLTQRAQVGVARASYYPTLNATASEAHNFADVAPGTDREQTRVSLSSDWLLWDFGGRKAGLSSAQRTLDALQATYDNFSQQVALSAVQAAFNRLSAAAVTEAAQASVQAAEETAKAAHQRVVIGAGTREDELQAQTALAQARLNLIQSQGSLASADGQLAVVAGYPAQRKLNLRGLLPSPDASTPPPLEQLLSVAETRRPDLLAQQQTLAAASSDLDRIAAQARPRISLATSRGDLRDRSGRTDTGQIALTATLPLFTGFQQRNQEAAARSLIDQQAIELDRLRQQISLDVWQAWQQLETARAGVGASDALLSAADQSNQAALARYRAGLGSLLNVLTAQSNLASARQQQAGARYTWAAARLQLAQASGLLVQRPENLLVIPPAPEPAP